MGQSYFHVEVETSTNQLHTFKNIEEAVEGFGSWPGASAGDKVVIYGAVDGQGNALAYSNAPGMAPEHSGDNFPLDVEPGVTITAAPGPPVYVFSTTGGTVFRAVPTSAAKTIISKVGIAGADTGIEAVAGSGGVISLTVLDVDFGPNSRAVDAYANGGTVICNVADCTIGNPATLPTPAPASKDFSIGLRFRASAAGTTVGRVDGFVESLTLAGSFPASDMAPEPFIATSGPKHDLEAYGNTFTRVIEVSTTALGDGLGEHPQLQPPFTRNPIPTATVTVSSVMDGKASAGGGTSGWDVGIYATTSPDYTISSGDFDYSNAFDLQVNGSVLKNFRAAGVYAETFVNSRGRVNFSGQTGVQKTGVQETPGSGNTFLRSGVHAVNQEGYLAITGKDAAFKNNHGNGVYVYDYISMRSLTYFPAGLFLGLESCKIYGNGLHGVSLDAARTKAHMGSPTQGGTVGGTQDNFSPAALPLHGSLSLIRSGNEPVPQDWDYGQGFINGCAISDNGGAGIHAFIVGTEPGLPTTFASPYASISSCRIENTFVWDNDEGGVIADLHPWPGNAFGPGHFMPIVHSTVTSNGGPSGVNFNADISAVAPSSFWYSGDPSGYSVQTELFNSIFQRANPTHLDWGPSLEGLIESDLGAGPSSHTKVGAAGVRAAWSLTVPLLSLATRSLNGLEAGGPYPAPFVGGTFATGEPDHLFLGSGPEPLFYLCPTYFTVFTAWSDCGTDYLGTNRSTISDRDKGGHEKL